MIDGITTSWLPFKHVPDRTMTRTDVFRDIEADNKHAGLYRVANTSDGREEERQNHASGVGI